MSPGDDDVVGVGMTVIATLNRSVTGAADRALVEARFTVATTPKVVGAWRWMSPTELHYRSATYWAAGTTIKAELDARGWSQRDLAFVLGKQETQLNRILSGKGAVGVET